MFVCLRFKGHPPLCSRSQCFLLCRPCPPTYYSLLFCNFILCIFMDFFTPSFKYLCVSFNNKHLFLCPIYPFNYGFNFLPTSQANLLNLLFLPPHSLFALQSGFLLHQNQLPIYQKRQWTFPDLHLVYVLNSIWHFCLFFFSWRHSLLLLFLCLHTSISYFNLSFRYWWSSEFCHRPTAFPTPMTAPGSCP